MAMSSFYAMPEGMRVIFTMLAIVTTIVAAMVLTIRRSRHDRVLYHWFDGALCSLVLVQVLLNTLLIARVQLDIADGSIVHSGYDALRYAVFSAIAALFACHCIINRPLPPLFVLAASFLTLPIMETWTGDMFPAYYATALIIIFFSGLWVFIVTRNELKSSLSGLSVMQAMDSLNTAVLYYNSNGHILLRNEKMRELMIETAGRVLYNGKTYLETIVVPNSEKAGESGTLSGENYIYRLAGSVWLYTVKDFVFEKTSVTQLFATDVTEQDYINLILKLNQWELIRRHERLREMVENIEDICRSEELLRLRAALHDEQNQKLTILLRYLRQGQSLDDDILSVVGIDRAHGIGESHGHNANSKEEVAALVSVYGQAGVRIILNENIPEDAETASVLVHILREAAANAVIHGYASEVYATIKESNNETTMRITDNGALAPKKIREGSGISEMRRRLAVIGGNLEIDTEGGFSLNVTVPGIGVASG